MSGGFDVEELIEQVRKHVYLYDISHRKYKDSNLKAAVWDSIAQRMNINCDAVKHKWKTVRDGYIKYKKQLKKSEESGKKVIDYVWSSQLAFLDNYNVSRKTNPVLNYALQPQVQLFEESNGSQVSPTPTQWETDDEPLAKRKKNVEHGDVDQIMNYISGSRTKCSDAVDHLFMSYAETFKKFTARRQAEMKIELAKLFSAAELNQLHDFQSTEELQPAASHTSQHAAQHASQLTAQHASQHAAQHASQNVAQHASQHAPQHTSHTPHAPHPSHDYNIYAIKAESIQHQ